MLDLHDMNAFTSMLSLILVSVVVIWLMLNMLVILRSSWLVHLAGTGQVASFGGHSLDLEAFYRTVAR